MKNNNYILNIINYLINSIFPFVKYLSIIFYSLLILLKIFDIKKYYSIYWNIYLQLKKNLSHRIELLFPKLQTGIVSNDRNKNCNFLQIFIFINNI